MTMSLTALAVVLSGTILFGVVHEADEGVIAHIWQLLMAGQLPILAMQIGVALAAVAPVYLLGL